MTVRDASPILEPAEHDLDHCLALRCGAVSQEEWFRRLYRRLSYLTGVLRCFRLGMQADLRPDFPPAFGRIRRLVSGLMRPWFPVSISLQIPPA